MVFIECSSELCPDCPDRSEIIPSPSTSRPPVARPSASHDARRPARPGCPDLRDRHARRHHRSGPEFRLLSLSRARGATRLAAAAPRGGLLRRPAPAPLMRSEGWYARPGPRCLAMNALHSSLRVLVPLLLGAAPLSSRASAQSIRISGDLAPVRTGGVQQHLFTPDGSRFVYRADRAGNGSFELLSVPTDGSAPAQPLNGPLPPGGSVKGLVGLGTGGLVAYVADQTTQGTFELYSVPADGSASPTLLSPSMVSIGFLSMPAGGDFVLYSLCQGLDCTYYRVPLDGSAAPIPVIAGFVIGETHFSPDASTTVFKHFAGFGGGFELYSVPSDGS